MKIEVVPMIRDQFSMARIADSYKQTLCELAGSEQGIENLQKNWSGGGRPARHEFLRLCDEARRQAISASAESERLLPSEINMLRFIHKIS